jgi:uncharacterized membrane protein YphA (DoxX/SURF4 family)
MDAHKSVTTFWNRFWFKSVDARQFAALRIIFGILSCIYFVGFLPYVESQFSTTGWLGNLRQIAVQNGGSWSYFFIQAFDYAELYANAIVVVGIVSAFLMAIGWHSCVATSLTWLVWVSLWNRNPLLMDGDDAVLKLMCFYLLLSPCANCWAIDAYFNKKPMFVCIWPLRLIQFQVALIYLVSGWVKFHSQEWEDGTIIQYIMVHPQYSRWDGWAIINLPFSKEIFAGLAWFIRWWELFFPVLLVIPHTRKLNIFIGILFHLGLLFTMNLRWFAVIMLSLYLTLIPNSCFSRFEHICIKNFRLKKSRQNNS